MAADPLEDPNPATLALVGLHPLLQAGLEAARREDWPGPPRHAGGPSPHLTAVDHVRVALWCAERFFATTPELERAQLQEVIGLVRGYLKDPVVVKDRLSTKPPRAEALLKTLAPVSKSQKGESLGLTCARRASEAAALLCSGRYDVAYRKAPDPLLKLVASEIRDVVERLSRQSPRESSPSVVREFLLALDGELCRLECAGAVMKRFKKPPPLRSVPWRAADSRGRTAWWIARFEDGSYGLLGRLGEQWSWVTGPRDDVLASVPDACFSQATLALVGEERSS